MSTHTYLGVVPEDLRGDWTPDGNYTDKGLDDVIDTIITPSEPESIRSL